MPRYSDKSVKSCRQLADFGFVPLLEVEETISSVTPSVRVSNHVELHTTHMLGPLASNNPWTPQALYVRDDIVGVFLREYWFEGRHAIGSAQTIKDHLCQLFIAVVPGMRRFI